MAFGNLLFWIIYIFVERKEKWEIPFYIRFITLLSITFNDFLGDYFNLYVTSAIYDRFQHIFGTYALTLWIFYVLQQLVKIKLNNKKLITIFIISLALALGTFYELIEFMEDEIYKPTVRNQPSLEDTNLDLISDFCGGILSVLHYHLSTRLSTFTFPFERKSSQG